jgi:hypothetical protein
MTLDLLADIFFSNSFTCCHFSPALPIAATTTHTNLMHDWECVCEVLEVTGRDRDRERVCVCVCVCVKTAASQARSRGQKEERERGMKMGVGEVGKGLQCQRGSTGLSPSPPSLSLYFLSNETCDRDLLSWWGHVLQPAALSQNLGESHLLLLL